LGYGTLVSRADGAYKERDCAGASDTPREVAVQNGKKLVAPSLKADILAYLHPCVGVFLKLGERVMTSSVMAELDFIEELRLRRWARENYVPRGERKHSWHPVIQEEMDKKELEGSNSLSTPAYAWPER
jgi:hypothetical protein